jgi:phage-related protein
LRDGIYELRVRHLHVNYRLTYFFEAGRAVLSHGLTKTDTVPIMEIDRAIARREAFVRAPERHTYEE